MDGGAWKAAVHGVAECRIRLSIFTFTFHFHALEKEMATHSSVLAWRIPGTGEPGGLLSVGSHRLGHDWSDLAVALLPKNRMLGGNHEELHGKQLAFVINWPIQKPHANPEWKEEPTIIFDPDLNGRTDKNLFKGKRSKRKEILRMKSKC